MNCPNCGAPMSLVGPSWHCTHCMTIVAPESAAPGGVRRTGEAGRGCPVCRMPLERAVIDDRDPIEICPECKGILMERRAFATTLVARREAATTPSVPPRESHDPAEMDRRLACPACGARMVTDWYYGPGNIVIDTCPGCDLVWLDAGELQRATDAPGPDRRA